MKWKIRRSNLWSLIVSKITKRPRVVTLKSDLGYSKFNFEIKVNDSNYSIVYSPTGNCQLMSGVEIGTSLSFMTDLELRHFLEYGLRAIAKPNLLIDVRENIAKSIENRLTPECFLLNAPYGNTTGHDMRMMIINRSSAIDHLKKPKVFPQEENVTTF